MSTAISDMFDALQGPIIVWPGYEQDLPNHLKEAIQTQRLLQAAKGDTDRATDAEVVAYLMTASLANPPSRDWAEIYLFLATKFLGKRAPKQFKKEHSTPLTDQQERELDKLRLWIRKKQGEARGKR